MIVSCLASAQFPVAPPRYAASPDGKWLAVWRGHGEIDILGDNLELADRVRIAPDSCLDIDQMAFSPDGNSLAVVGLGVPHVSGGSATVFTRQGQIRASHTWSGGLHGGGSGCVFSGDGRLLWVASRPGLLVLDVESNRVVASHPLDFLHREWGPYDFLLYRHPEGEVVGVWAAYGPDVPTHLYWSRLDRGRLEIYQQPCLHGVGTPEFHPSGCEFLTLPDDGSLVRYRFPSCEVLGTLYEEDAFGEEDGEPSDQFAVEVFYVSDNRALVTSNEEVKTLLLDVSTMQVLDEVEFEGCPPSRRPLLVAFRPPSGLWTTNFTEKKMRTVQLWDIRNLVGTTSQPDPSWPLTAQLVKEGKVLP